MKIIVRKKYYYLFIFLFLFLIKCYSRNVCNSIDRYGLVNRHLPVCNKADSLSPFTVGNGEFAFTVDITGLQTLPEFYEKGIPLVTQSNWGWHNIPNIDEYNDEQTYQYYDTYGRYVPYASIMNSKAAKYLRGNPHRLHLGRIGFKRIDPEYSDLNRQDISNINQVMNISDRRAPYRGTKEYLFKQWTQQLPNR